MIKQSGIIAAVILLLSLLSCSKSQEGSETFENGGSSEEGGEASGTVLTFDVNYEEDNTNFCNPERGLYNPIISYFNNGSTPSLPTINNIKANREVGISLTFTEFYLQDYRDDELSQGVIDFVAETFARHREGGCKAVVRFAYTDSMDESAQPWDAPLDIVLRHIEQLKPVLQEYADVIYVLQAGFVGSWGEWYYTNNFNMNPSTEEDYEPRRQVVMALLDALPQNRQIALRTASYKRMTLGTTIADTITAATAFDGSNNSRVAGHNDCFISSSNDVGTYISAYDRTMWRAETNYVSMGGETCAANTTYCACTPATSSLEDFHWSYLNVAYYTGVFDVWRDGGCYDENIMRLGYRLVLNGANFGEDHSAGAEFPITVNLTNKGFASLINERPMEFVLVNKSDSTEIYTIESDTDPRIWKGGKTYTWETSIQLPVSLKAGVEYNLYLNLPDAAQNLRGNPNFSVRLANKGVWDEDTGYNLLTSFVAD